MPDLAVLLKIIKFIDSHQKYSDFRVLIVEISSLTAHYTYHNIMSYRDSIDSQDQNKIEYRKVQAIHGNSTFVLVLPRDFVSMLNIAKGDYVKCKVKDNQLIVERAEV